jgi:hypothetical protein
MRAAAPAPHGRLPQVHGNHLDVMDSPVTSWIPPHLLKAVAHAVVSMLIPCPTERLFCKSRWALLA